MKRFGIRWLIKLMFIGVSLTGIGVAWLAVSASPAAAATSCSVSGGTASVQLDQPAASPTTTLSQDSASDLLVNGSACGSGFPTAIALSVAADAPAQTVVLDQTGAGGVFPCTTEIDGTLRSTDSVTIKGAAAENLTVGDTASGSGINLNSCTSVGTITEVGSYRLAAGSGSVALSAGGGTGFTSALSLPATLQAASGGSETFVGGSVTDTIDFSALSSALVVNVSGGSVGSTASGTATSGADVYSFSSFGSTPVIFDGAAAATTFVAGSVADTFNGSAGGVATLSFADASGASLRVCVVSGSGCSAAEALLGSTAEPFSDIADFVGLASGDSTFVIGSSGGQGFAGSGGGNVLDASAAPAGATVDVSTGLVTGLTSASEDSFSGISSFVGATAGQTTFVTGGGSETFSDPGSAAGDVLDFGAIQTSASAPWTVNLSGGPVGGSAQIGSDTASNGTVTDTFSSGAAGFSGFDGSSSGFTTFVVGGGGGKTFTGHSNGNVLDASAAGAGITVDASKGEVTGLNSNGEDMFSGITSFTGSAAGNTTFIGGSGNETLTGQGAGNTFDAGAGNETFVDAGSGSTDTIDFSALSSALVVNVSGGSVGSTASGTATSGADVYSFSSFGSTPVIFDGAAAATTFVAGSVADTFNGSAGGVATLSFADASGASLRVCVVSGSGCSAAEALLGSTAEPFSDIADFVGLASGDSTFVIGSSGGQGFAGSGGGNVLDASAAPAGATVDVSTGLVTGLTSASEDSFSGISSFVGATAGQTTFVTGGGSETFSDPGSAAGDVLDFGAIQTSASAPWTVNLSGGPVGGSAQIGSDTASNGTVTDTFSSGAAGFSGFDGSSSGFTTFVVGGGGGKTFTGHSNGNVLDASAAGAGITVDASKGEVTGLNSNGEDMFSGITSFTGSAAGNTTFIATGAGGFSFTGLAGSGNVLNLTAVANPSLDVPDGQVSGLTGSGTDDFSGIQLFTLAIQFASSPPSAPVVGDSYTPTVVGAPSTNPVLLSTVAGTTNDACSLSGDTVVFQHAGSCVVTATQAGEGQFTDAQPASQQMIVGPGATTTVVTVAPHALSATVSGPQAVTTIPTGTVTFEVDGTSVGHASLNDDGVATLSYTVPSSKAHTVAAIYSGDNDFTGSSDSTARDNPTIRARVASAHSRTSYGWYRSAVTVSFSCDATSAPLVGHCPSPVKLTHQGAGQQVTETVSATDGGVATVVVSPINIDTAAPSIHVTGVTSGRTYQRAPHLTARAVDRLSGVASVHVTRKRHVRRGFTEITYTVRAVDKAGNVRVVTGHYRVKR